MKIVYSTDQNYVKHCAASIVSLFENNIEEKELDLIIIVNQVLEESKEKIKKISYKYKRNIIFINIDELCEKFTKNNTFPLSAFARLFLENIQGIDKILYIDCDTIIKGKLNDLWNINIDNYYLAGVEDTIQPYAKRVLGLSKNDKYLNSGILLINLKKWRENNIKKDFLAYMEKYNWNVPHNDQGVLNGVCKDKILYISPKYNMMPELLIMNNKQLKKLYKMKEYYSDEILEYAKKDIRIIHYLTKFFNRPWYNPCTHPLKEEYMKYLSKTGFGIKLINDNLKFKIRLQKFIFEKTNFHVFLILERVLDIRREIKCFFKYKNKC